MKKAVVLLSGGLDSATCLAIARSEGFECHALSFDYGQKAIAELNAARLIAKDLGAFHRVFKLDIGQFGGSALTDERLEVPADETFDEIPITYVPARNTVFLSIALALAEVLGAGDIYYGANAVDYSGYPDCRPEFKDAFELVANQGTKAGVEGEGFKIHAPLMYLKKSEIIQKGSSLNLDYNYTVSCYKPNDTGEACGLCESCKIRRQGFKEAGLQDQTRYINSTS